MSINSKSTKAEILAAYKAMEKELKAERSKATSSAPKTVNNNSNSSPSNNNKPMNSQTNLIKLGNMEKTITTLQNLQVGFGGAVGNLSEQLITEATTLEEIGELIAEEKQQLADLHELTEIEDDTLDELLEQYEISNKQFAEELQLARENADREIQELKQSWAKEKETHNREIKARNEEYKKNKQREAEEYQYNLDLERDRDEAEYEQEKKSLYSKLAESRQQLEKEWQEKENTISNKEKEYTEAESKVAEMEEKIIAKIKQGVAEGQGIGNYQAKIKKDLRLKEIEGKRQNYQLKIQSLQNTIENQTARIAKLSLQLGAAEKQVQDLAVKAIEGASNRNSFEAMKQIAMEQAKTQQKGK